MDTVNKTTGNTSVLTRTGLRIVLERNGTPLYEMYTGEYEKEFEIGRAPGCHWTLDGIDHSASRKHALITKRHGSFYVLDIGSRNGIYYNNRRVKEVKLKVGDRISIGECVLYMDGSRKSTSKVPKVHQLRYTDEHGKQRLYSIRKEKVTIGSNGDCELPVKDQLVSGHHAELSIREDGSCWIRDLNSRNGTSVNGMELPPESERLLQDNDVISIAYFDFKFWDADGVHHESRLWATFLTLAFTIVIMLGCYAWYIRKSDDAPTLLRLAEIEMAADRLDRAEAFIEQSYYAKESDRSKPKADMLKRRIGTWKMVRATWASVQDGITERRDGRFTRAVLLLGGIVDADNDSWSWPGGTEEKDRAVSLKGLLDAYFSTRSLLNTGAGLEELSKRNEELREQLGRVRERYGVQAPLFTELIGNSEEMIARIDDIMLQDKYLDETLALLDPEALAAAHMKEPDYGLVFNRLNEIRKTSGPVYSRAEKIRPAVEALHHAKERLSAMEQKVCSMDFKAVEDFSLDLPETINYAIEKNIGTWKRYLMEQVEDFKDTTVQLQRSHDVLSRKGVEPGKPVPALELFADQRIMESVFAVDSLNLPLVSLRRPAPQGMYDEMLGIEFFHDYISTVMEAEGNKMQISELPFEPRLYTAKSVLQELESFVQFASQEKNQWFNNDKFAVFIAHCRQLLQRRDEVIDILLSRDDSPDSRKYLISHGIACYLMPEGESPQEFIVRNEEGNEEVILKTRKDKLKQDVETVYRSNLSMILHLNVEYRASMPDEQMEIRRKIIENGIPGNPVVKIMWAQRPETGWKDVKKEKK